MVLLSTEAEIYGSFCIVLDIYLNFTRHMDYTNCLHEAGVRLDIQIKSPKSSSLCHPPHSRVNSEYSLNNSGEFRIIKHADRKQQRSGLLYNFRLVTVVVILVAASQSTCYLLVREEEIQARFLNKTLVRVEQNLLRQLFSVSFLSHTQ